MSKLLSLVEEGDEANLTNLTPRHPKDIVFIQVSSSGYVSKYGLIEAESISNV